MELVDVEIERRERSTGIVRTRERRHKEFPNQNEAEEVRIALAEPSFRKIHKQYLLSVDNLTEVKGALLLSDNGAHEVVSGELIELVRDIRHDVLQTRLAFCLAGDLLPELIHDRIIAPGELQISELCVREYATNIHERGAGCRVLHHELGSIAEVLLKRRTHTLRHVAIELPEDSEHFVHDE